MKHATADFTTRVSQNTAGSVLQGRASWQPHNATLNGTEADECPNLAWMATDEHAREFSAMISAVRAWADTQKGWVHPLKAIKDALLKKASGRVFQTDTDVSEMAAFGAGSTVDWEAFQARTHGDRLYFDYTVTA